MATEAVWAAKNVFALLKWNMLSSFCREASSTDMELQQNLVFDYNYWHKQTRVLLHAAIFRSTVLFPTSCMFSSIITPHMALISSETMGAGVETSTFCRKLKHCSTERRWALNIVTLKTLCLGSVLHFKNLSAPIVSSLLNKQSLRSAAQQLKCLCGGVLRFVLGEKAEAELKNERFLSFFMQISGEQLW